MSRLLQSFPIPSTSTPKRMESINKMQWIEVNHNALEAFGRVPAIVVCENCKQVVITNKDWIPELNHDYAEWTDHNLTVIPLVKIWKPKFKSFVESVARILEKGFFHDLKKHRYFTLEQFNEDL